MTRTRKRGGIEVRRNNKNYSRWIEHDYKKYPRDIGGDIRPEIKVAKRPPSNELVHPSRRINFGADPPSSSEKVDPASLPTTASTPAALTNGIHPSRLALLDDNTPTQGLGSPSDTIMGPGQPPESRPGRQQRHAHNQPKSALDGSNVNGDYHQGDLQGRPHHQQREVDKEQPSTPNNGLQSIFAGPGPMPNHIQVAKPYVFQQAIEGCLRDVGVSQAREDSIRLAGVQWIDSVRRALKLPVRTFDSAVIYYHKFRLVHSDGEYSFVDAAAAALFAACKTEDTLKKSRDILCAAHNLKIPNRSEHLSPDDSSFEQHSRSIIGLERLMLESSSFDFRNRHPQALLIKLARFYRLEKSSSVFRTAYTISLDVYRTFAPLKQCTATIAFACLELSARLRGELDTHPGLQDIANGRGYDRWKISRAEVMETLLDLLELYTHYRTSTSIGPDFSLDTFLDVRISLNKEMNDRNIPRFTEYVAPSNLDSRADVGSYAATVNGLPAAASAATATSINGATRGEPSPISPSTAGGRPNGVRQKAGERGREGTVRFILNPDREQQERAVVAEYDIPPPLCIANAVASTPHIPHQPARTGTGNHTPTTQGGINRSRR